MCLYIKTPLRKKKKSKKCISRLLQGLNANLFQKALTKMPKLLFLLLLYYGQNQQVLLTNQTRWILLNKYDMQQKRRRVQDTDHSIIGSITLHFLKKQHRLHKSL